MRMRSAFMAAVLLLSACSDGATDDDLAALERRVGQLEAEIATTTTTIPATTTTFDIDARPPVTLPTDQATNRLYRRLPAVYSELWEPEWCLANPDALAGVAEPLGIDFPEEDWAIAGWITSNPEDFQELCVTALTLADPAADDFAEVVDAQIVAAVSEIVGEVATDSSDLMVMLEEMDEELRQFCAASPQLVYDAAFALGRLPQGASDDLTTYWAVTRPQEYAAACELAHESR